MTVMARISPYLARGLLLLAAALFANIGFRSVVDPQGAAVRYQMSLHSAAAATVMQVGFGAFPLAVGIVAAAAAMRRRTLSTGLALVFVVAFTALTVRLYSIHLYGAGENLRPLFAEAVLSFLSAATLLFERNAARLSAR